MLLCPPGFYLMHGVYSNMHWQVLNSIKQGEDLDYIKTRKSIDIDRAPKQELCSSRLKQYIDSYCEQDPVSQEAHLPVIMLNVDLYDLFVEDMITNHGMTLHSIEMPQPGIFIIIFFFIIRRSKMLGTFYFVWKNEFPRLVCPRNSRLGSCHTCVKLKNMRPQFANETKLWRELKTQHKSEM